MTRKYVKRKLTPPVPVLPHGMPAAVYVVDFQYVYGPFVDLETAKGWVRAPHYTFGSPTYIILGPLQRIGTVDAADSVGTVQS